MQHADEFFALSQAEWGCTANERLIQIDGPGFMALHAAELAAQLADEPIDGIGAPEPRCCATSRWASCRC